MEGHRLEGAPPGRCNGPGDPVSPYDQPPLSAHAFGVSIGRECRRDHRGVRKRGSPRTYGADYLGRPTRLVDVASASGSWPWVPPASVGAAVDGSQVGERVVRLEAAGSEPGDGCQGPLRSFRSRCSARRSRARSRPSARQRPLRSFRSRCSARRSRARSRLSPRQRPLRSRSNSYTARRDQLCATPARTRSVLT
jgi:hypothetical protein